GRCSVVAISSPQVIGVVFVMSNPTEKRNSAMAEGLKMCVRRPSRFHLTNSLKSTPVATIRNCKKNQSFLYQRKRLVLKIIGNGPKPRTHLSRRDQQTSMSSPYTKAICASTSGACEYTWGQYFPQ